ncbi:MAG: endonuclease MutS2 [Clostridia bacterium]|nr:endonuclease MutS2 [Clostridia bacterium]
MRERNLRVLEFTKIRDMLAAFAISDMGKERVLALEPSSDPNEVRQLQQQTEEAGTVIAYTGGNPMLSFTDVREHLKRAAIGATLNPKALLDVAESLRAARGVRSALVTDRENTPLITGMASGLATNRPLEEEIFDAILSEDEISDHASPELYDIRRHIRQCNDRVREKLNSIIHNPAMQKYLQDAIITQRAGRYVIPVRAEARQFVQGLIHDQSSSGATLFIEPMGVVEAGNDLKQWTGKEQQEIERILRALSQKVAPDADLMAANLSILAELDMIFAKAYLGRDMRATTPNLNTEGRINIKFGRHPLIDPTKVVPMNLWMGQDFTTLVVTGPNTGGKTVTLKTVGLMTLMAQAGLMVPAEIGTDLAIFDEVFADIGDEQSIEQSLSTFSSHMTNIVSILENVTPQSLVLFDELGAGTDPTEGAALAMSILETLKEQGVRTLATTHYAELKAYALSTVGVENASVEFDIETLRPTYRLSIGVPGKSNAFEISRKLGLPDYIIKSANAKLTKDQIRFEDVIANAEYHRQVAERERKLAEDAHKETQALRDEAEKLRREISEQRDSMLRKAKEDARKVLVKAQRESEQLIADLKKARSKDGVSFKEHELNEIRNKLQGSIDDMSDGLRMQAETVTAPPKDLKPGETVELLALGTKGTIVTPPDAKGEALVQAGIMKLKVHVSQMRRAQEEKKKPKPASTVTLAGRTATMECDVRGMTLEEAIQAVDLFLDGCVMQSLKNVQIIHGKGTGTLRSGIQQHLKKHPSVAEFRLGKYGEGEDGVTVVTLK